MSSYQKQGQSNGRSDVRHHQINCAPCRKRKSKCDREEPCSSCVLRQTEAYCYTNEEPPPPKSATARSPASSSSKRTLDDMQINSKPAKVNKVVAVRERQTASQVAQNAIESMEASLEAVKKYMHTTELNKKTSLATSSHSTYIEWDDLMMLLPPLSDLSHIITCYFSELTWVVGCVHQERFNTMWADALERRGPLPRHRAALLCSMVALVDLMAPRSHPAAQLQKKASLDQVVQRENARILLEVYYSLDDAEEQAGYRPGIEPFALTQQEALLQLEAETVYSGYACAAGLYRRGWQAVGRAIRLGKSLSVFASTRQRNERWEEEHRCRIGWELIVLDRWTSMFYSGTFELGLQYSPPWYEPGHDSLSYRNTFTNNLSQIIGFKQNYRTMEMTQKAAFAEAIEGDMVQWESTLPSRYRYDVSCASMNSNDPDSFRTAAKALNFHIALQYAYCVLWQPFLMDPAAPSHLQFASLVHARKIIESMHVIATLCNSPWVAHSPAWNAQLLFVAATVFANVFLTDPEDKGLMKSWPAEDLDWFARAIFEVVDTFHLVAQGTRHQTARICQDLLIALCNSKDTLKTRYQARERQFFRPSTPTIFPDSSRNSQPDLNLDPALQQPIDPLFKSSQASNNAFSQKTINLDSFGLFDPWEWARLTANLDT